MLASVSRLAMASIVLAASVGCCNIPGRGWNRECCNNQSCFCYAPKLESCPSCCNSCVECKRCCDNGPTCPWLQSRPCGFMHWLVHGFTWGESGPIGGQSIAGCSSGVKAAACAPAAN